MADEWRRVRIGDIGHVVTGRTPPGNDPTYYGDSLPFLTPTDMIDCRRVESTGRRLSRQGVRQLERCVVPQGVSVSCIGWQMGKAMLIDRPVVTNQQINSIIVDNTVADTLFVYYSMSSRRKELFNRGAGGSRTPILNKGDFERLPFILPSLPEQRAISHVLGALDDKIELNRRMNETLEAMARAQFRSWFVDFDPVRAKAEGWQPAGMEALFPDAFEESELGDIPRGWSGSSLEGVADFLNGLAMQRFPPTGDSYLPVIKIAELRRGVNELSGRASANLDSRYVVDNGDVLFSWSGSLDAVIWCGGRGALNQHLFKVTSSRYPRWFYFFWIREHLPSFRRIAAGKATTMGHIQRHHLQEAFVPAPPSDLVWRADRLIGPLVERLVGNSLESTTLTTIRDALLPKLLSGEIRLGDLEAKIGAIV